MEGLHGWERRGTKKRVKEEGIERGKIMQYDLKVEGLYGWEKRGVKKRRVKEEGKEEKKT